MKAQIKVRAGASDLADEVQQRRGRVLSVFSVRAGRCGPPDCVAVVRIHSSALVEWEAEPGSCLLDWAPL